MRIHQGNPSRIELASGVMGILGAVGLVATIALGFYLKLGNLGKALHFRVNIATCSLISGTVAALALSALLWKAKTA